MWLFAFSKGLSFKFDSLASEKKAYFSSHHWLFAWYCFLVINFCLWKIRRNILFRKGTTKSYPQTYPHSMFFCPSFFVFLVILCILCAACIYMILQEKWASKMTNLRLNLTHLRLTMTLLWLKLTHLRWSMTFLRSAWVSYRLFIWNTIVIHD